MNYLMNSSQSTVGEWSQRIDAKSHSKESPPHPHPPPNLLHRLLHFHRHTLPSSTSISTTQPPPPHHSTSTSFPTPPTPPLPISFHHLLHLNTHLHRLKTKYNSSTQYESDAHTPYGSGSSSHSENNALWVSWLFPLGVPSKIQDHGSSGVHMEWSPLGLQEF